MSDLPRHAQRRLEFQARKIEQLELVIASQSDLISLLRSQLHIHTESTLLLQRRFGDACTSAPAASVLAVTAAAASATTAPSTSTPRCRTPASVAATATAADPAASPFVAALVDAAS